MHLLSVAELRGTCQNCILRLGNLSRLHRCDKFIQRHWERVPISRHYSFPPLSVWNTYSNLFTCNVSTGAAGGTHAVDQWCPGAHTKYYMHFMYMVWRLTFIFGWQGGWRPELLQYYPGVYRPSHRRRPDWRRQSRRLVADAPPRGYPPSSISIQRVPIPTVPKLRVCSVSALLLCICVCVAHSRKVTHAGTATVPSLNIDYVCEERIAG